MLHPWGRADFFFAAVCNMYVMWAPQMRHTDVDKAWWKAVRYYSTNQDDKNAAGRALQTRGRSFLFWGFFLERGGVACERRGVVVSGEHSVESPFSLRYISVIIHPAAALLTVGLFLIHVLHGCVC